MLSICLCSTLSSGSCSFSCRLGSSTASRIAARSSLCFGRSSPWSGSALWTLCLYLYKVVICIICWRLSAKSTAWAWRGCSLGTCGFDSCYCSIYSCRLLPMEWFIGAPGAFGCALDLQLSASSFLAQGSSGFALLLGWFIAGGFGAAWMNQMYWTTFTILEELQVLFWEDESFLDIVDWLLSSKTVVFGRNDLMFVEPSSPNSCTKS